MPGATKTAPKSDRLELAMAISSITAKQDAFIKAVEKMDEFRKEVLNTLDIEIDAKKAELNDLKEEYARQEKDGEIRVNQHLAEYRYQGALKYLEEVDEVPIKDDELTGLRSELESLRQDNSEEMETLRKHERAEAKIAVQSAVRNCELTHKAETAQLHAEVEQQKKEILTLEKTIENLRHELSEQRKLTKEVAESARMAAPIHQHMGK